MPTLELRNIHKNFGSVQALCDVDLTMCAGEVVGLMGDNGAGKSTLVKIIGGLLRPEQGQVFLEGQTVALASPRAAQAHGIAVVHQDLALCDNFTAAENVFLGKEPVRRFGPLALIDHKAIRQRATQMFAELESTAPPDALVGNLSGGQRQATAIARVLTSDAKVILLDEPTAAIGLRQVEDVLALIKRLKERGRAVLIVSHRMGDIFAVADRIAVLWRGAKIADKAVAETSPEEIAGFITGANREVA
ncbi:MAG: sugar ABC transporter ATP-binding protein [Alphaproteobacteria bacterium]|nr:sugar ABC transporter ATP-binding protein [Alphaproteobacteria bacterium]